MKSKIHNMVVTDAHLDYQGSLGIDEDIMDAVGLYDGEKVLVINASNNARYETYVIPEERGSKKLVVLGPAARSVQIGDSLVIISWAHVTEEELSDFKPKIVVRP